MNVGFLSVCLEPQKIKKTRWRKTMHCCIEQETQVAGPIDSFLLSLIHDPKKLFCCQAEWKLSQRAFTNTNSDVVLIPIANKLSTTKRSVCGTKTMFVWWIGKKKQKRKDCSWCYICSLSFVSFDQKKTKHNETNQREKTKLTFLVCEDVQTKLNIPKEQKQQKGKRQTKIQRVLLFVWIFLSKQKKMGFFFSPIAKPRKMHSFVSFLWFCFCFFFGRSCCFVVIAFSIQLISSCWVILVFLLHWPTGLSCVCVKVRQMMDCFHNISWLVHPILVFELVTKKSKKTTNWSTTKNNHQISKFWVLSFFFVHSQNIITDVFWDKRGTEKGMILTHSPHTQPQCRSSNSFLCSSKKNTQHHNFCSVSLTENALGWKCCFMTFKSGRIVDMSWKQNSFVPLLRGHPNNADHSGPLRNKTKKPKSTICVFFKEKFWQKTPLTKNVGTTVILSTLLTVVGQQQDCWEWWSELRLPGFPSVLPTNADSSPQMYAQKKMLTCSANILPRNPSIEAQNKSSTSQNQKLTVIKCSLLRASSPFLHCHCLVIKSPQT